MIHEAIVKVVNKMDLSYEEAYKVMDEIMSGNTSQIQNAAFLAALTTKNSGADTIDEISGCAAAMRAKATKVDHGMDVMDIVGTGGDGSNSFNISTASALVVASAGVKVAKHGNRAASSKCGTADCLEALGVKIDVGPEKCVELLRDVGMCFLFAQRYHASMKFVAPVRKELGFRTVFNILGPLTNPASPSMQLLGVYSEALVEPLAEVLMRLGVKRGMVVHGMDGMDEISVCDSTAVCEIRDGTFRSFTVSPEEMGVKRCCREDLVGGTPEENAIILRSVLNGERGPRRDAVLVNAGAALYIADKATTLSDGVRMAAEMIDEGLATSKLDELISVSNA